MLRSSSVACLSASLGDKGLSSSANILQKVSVMHPRSCILAVLTLFLANSLPTSSCEASEMFCHFVLTTKPTQPRPQVFSVNCKVFWQLCCGIDVIFSHIAKFFQIWSTVAGYDELSMGFEPIRDGEIF